MDVAEYLGREVSRPFDFNGEFGNKRFVLLTDFSSFILTIDSETDKLYIKTLNQLLETTNNIPTQNSIPQYCWTNISETMLAEEVGFNMSNTAGMHQIDMHDIFMKRRGLDYQEGNMRIFQCKMYVFF